MPTQPIDFTIESTADWQTQVIQKNKKLFDLSIEKYPIEAIFTENGKQSIIKMGKGKNNRSKDMAKLEVGKKKLEKAGIQFRYSIRVANIGEVEGYVKEITDYLPQGLTFLPQDNPGWVDKGNGMIINTSLKNTLYDFNPIVAKLKQYKAFHLAHLLDIKKIIDQE